MPNIEEEYTGNTTLHSFNNVNYTNNETTNTITLSTSNCCVTFIKQKTICVDNIQNRTDFHDQNSTDILSDDETDGEHNDAVVDIVIGHQLNNTGSQVMLVSKFAIHVSSL